MNGFLLLNIVLTAVVGSVCTILYTRLMGLYLKIQQQKEYMERMETITQQMLDLQQVMHKRVDQLATDVLQREIYQNADDRHQMAILDAKQGHGLHELAKKHGLSTDEAALIIALHGKRAAPKVELKPLDNIGSNAPIFDLDGEEYR